MPYYDVECENCEKVEEIWLRMSEVNEKNYGLCSCGGRRHQTYRTPRVIMSAPFHKRIKRLALKEQNKVRARHRERFGNIKGVHIKSVIPVNGLRR